MKNRENSAAFFIGETALSKDFAAMYAASFLRFSTRRYFDKKIDTQHRLAINAFIGKINAFADGVRIVPVYDAAPGLFESFGYTKLAGVPGFLAVLTDKTTRADVKAGFYGEAACLKLTDMGVKTCWVSGSIKKQLGRKYMSIAPDERFLTTIAFGYGEDKSAEYIAAKRSRKSMEKIFEGEMPDDAIKKQMACVQNAPSAINRQPWRYRMSDGQLAVKKAVISGGPFPEALDIGISMLHASCAAGALGIGGFWRCGGEHLSVFSRG